MVGKKLTKTQNGARAFILLFLCIPLVLTFFKPMERPLNGAFQVEPDADLEFKTWVSGEFQEQKNKYLDQNFGLHNSYVRTICQMDYLLFRKANARFVVIGDDDYLYETSYLYSYYGVDFKGNEWISEQIRKLKRVQDTMQKLNKFLFAVIAPGKAFFYPEYIPNRFNSWKKENTNYNSFSTLAVSEGLNNIDFNRYFITQKARSKSPLYPQFGIHWSNYGALRAFDSICKYIENKLQCDLPDLIQTSFRVTDTLQSPDDDVLKGLNLISDPKTFPMAYPSYSVNNIKGKHSQPKLLVIADSFWWYIYASGLPDKVFGENRFWYYNEEMYPESAQEPYYVYSGNYFERIKQADIIILLYSEANLYKFANGFQDMIQEVYFPKDEIKEKMQRIKGQIRATPHWFDDIKKKAGLKNISPDSMLTLDALYILGSKE